MLIAVPVFNAFSHLQNLLDDLEREVQDLTDRFIFRDDASTEVRVKDLLLTHSFTQRKNVKVIFGDANLGFLKNINSILSDRKPSEDVVILNTDTRIFSDVFFSFRSFRNKRPLSASITPLSNNGTLASLVNWPYGENLSEAQLRQFSKVVNDMEYEGMDYLSVPTGVGFCMFMNGQVIDQIGFFNERFGKGYGEETDWCLRAADLGYENVISLKMFVAHVGTQSFTEGEKALALKNAERLVEGKHPHYQDQIRLHFAENPLRILRLKIALLVFTENKNIILQVLHDDPGRADPGGTEFHARDSLRAINEFDSGHLWESVEIFPAKNGGFHVRILNLDGSIFLGLYRYTDLTSVFDLLASCGKFIHFHHLKNWPNNAIEFFARFDRLKKLATIHDFWTICPSVNLLSFDDIFCGVERDKSRCSSCFKNYHRFKSASIDTHRVRVASLLNTCESIIFPSENTKIYFNKAFPELVAKTEVIPHSLSYLSNSVKDTLDIDIVSKSGKKLVFVGHVGFHKGIRFITNNLKMLKAAGYDVYILGTLDHEYMHYFEYAQVIPYRGFAQLKTEIQNLKPDLLGFASICAETFCYTFYESLALVDAVPVVGPLGNPSDQVEQNQIGVRFAQFEGEVFRDALNLAVQNKDQYLEKLKIWRENTYRNQTSELCYHNLFSSFLKQNTDLDKYFTFEWIAEESPFNGFGRLEVLAIKIVRKLRQWINYFPILKSILKKLKK